MSSRVFLLKCGHEVTASVKSVMELAGWQTFIPTGKDIVLKPNLGWDLFLPGCVTSPWVVEGVIQTVYDACENIYIADADQVLVDIDKAARKANFMPLTQKYKKVKWLNLSRQEMMEKEFTLGGQKFLLPIPRILFDSTLVSVPVMKTHGRCVVSLSLKNQWGCLPTTRHNFHPYLNEMIFQINNHLKPAFAVMDGTVCLEGNGPKSGKPKVCDVLLASSDLVALDTVAAKLMGFEPGDVHHVRYCAENGLGVSDLSQIGIAGDRMENFSFHFQSGVNNSVASVEGILRSSFVSDLIFKTPLLSICCAGAKIYYFFWYYFFGGGRQFKSQMLAHERYGRQWQEQGGVKP